ncbi:MAG: thioredoxin domain-containing protein [Deltaproteobacteria bacterium]|nr:thioredoxin domain-containing protein [Deltaproteobacteria bacterium]
MTTRRGWWWPLLVLALSGVGLMVAALSTQDHVTYVTSGGGKSFCAALTDTACQGAHSNAAAEIGGVPISLLGLSFYFGAAVLTLLALLVGRRESYGFLRAWPALLSMAAAAGVGYSVFLASVLIAENDWCPFCVAMYGVNGGLLLVSLSWAWPGLRRPSIPSLALCAGTLILAMVAAAMPAVAWYGTKVDVPMAADTVANDKVVFDSGTRRFQLPPLPDSLPSKGLSAAPATIIEFSDFECRYCATMHRVISTLFAQVGAERLRVRFVNFPLDNACNCYVSVCVHETACLAARAAICAQRADRFWEYADVSFANRRKHRREDLLGYARDLGLDPAAFGDCLDSDETTRTLQEDIELAHRVGVKATPTVVVNGVKFEGIMPLDRLQESLDRSEVCACDLAAEFCERHGNEKPSSCELEVVGGPPACR